MCILTQLLQDSLAQVQIAQVYAQVGQCIEVIGDSLFLCPYGFVSQLCSVILMHAWQFLLSYV